ncbi:MAG TPA: hypothetical protein DFR83_00185 [Deltaproteobacteria bacterium]|nr:hypothetical protein [Deltaproteobacteria bacterium]
MVNPPLEYRDFRGAPDARARLARLVAMGESLPLDEAALMVALDERADVDLDAARRMLDQFASRIHLRSDAPLQESVARVAINLFGEGRLQGDVDTYDDPQNSDLPQVLERKRGLPILLSIVMLGVARRLQLPLAGVSFPGHFLVGPTPGALAAAGLEPVRSFWIDPFHGGRMLGELDLKRGLQRNFPQAPEPTAEDWAIMTGPADPRQVLVRVNQNLKRSWAQRKEPHGTLRAIDRILMLQPRAWNQHRDRGLLLARLGDLPAAEESLMTYLAQVPDATDGPRISMILSSIRLGL